MANPMFDLNPMLGALAQPTTITNPVQNPLAGGNFDYGLMAQQRAALNELQKTYMRAQALKEEPLNAKGTGPFGARQGVGPMGWATTVGDLVAGLIAKGRRKAATEETAKASGAESQANQALIANVLQNQPGGPYGNSYGPGIANQLRRPDLNYVSQGSPLSLGSQ
jgi:hypothetical protein